MSYVPSHQSSPGLAEPVALTVIEHTASTTQTITVGNRVNIGTVHNWYGSFSPTISTNQITLPSGYYYYLESAVQAFKTGTFTATMHTSFRHYDETNSNNIGTEASVIQASIEDALLFSRDSCARALIDCTSSAVDISLKITANTTYDRINYNSSYYVRAGLGRTVIWQLEG